MSENNTKHVTYGNCSAGEPGKDNTRVGTNFNLSPMTDHFGTIIMDAIDKVDLSNVWAETTHISTVYIGSEAAVFDALKACFLQAYTEGVHMSLESTISKGCPGGSGQEQDIDLNPENPHINAEQTQDIDFPVIGKFAIYPLSSQDYMQVIEDVVNEGFNRGVISGTGHYATNLSGSVQDVFEYLEYVSKTVGEVVTHFVIQVTLHCNVPA